MIVLATLGFGAVGTGLWLHDWRSIAAGVVAWFAAWLIFDVDRIYDRL